MSTAEIPLSYTIPTSALPIGFDTVASFEAKHSPFALGLTVAGSDPANVAGLFAGDEATLTHLSEMIGLPVLTVPAAPAYRASGIETQRAFQVGLIYGVLHHAA
jgi:hypothetical protein